MKQSAIATLLLILLFSVFLVPLSFSPAKAAIATVYIQADGTIQGTSSIQRNGDLFTLTGNITGPLYVQKDNIVIDGAGYTLTGANGRGIVLAQRSGVTLKDTRVTLDGGYSIDVENAKDCTLVSNILVGTLQATVGAPGGQSLGPIAINFLYSQNITVKDNTITNFYIGLSLESSNDNTITGNTLTNGITGIDVSDTSGCVFRNNTMTNCSFSLRAYEGYQFDNDLDSSNTVNGKPIYYWVNFKDETVPSDAAYIVLVKCTNIKVENCAPQGICFISTTNSEITNVQMTGQGDGITLLDSTSVNVANNILHDQAIALEINHSSNSVISGNDISNHMSRGIALNDATNNLISGNTLTNNSYAAVQDSLSTGNTISSNNFTANEYTITLQGSIKIENNIFKDNQNGILFQTASGSTITQNTFTNNMVALYFSNSSDNSIYLNNFLENARQVSDSGVNSTLAQPVKAGSSSIDSIQLVAAHANGVNFIPPPPPSINRWDNGSQGNYWIGYTGSDKDGDGIGDTPYYIYQNNQDNYPLMNPIPVSGASASVPASSSPTPPPENKTQGAACLEISIIIIVIVMVIALGILAAWRYSCSRKQKGKPPQIKTSQIFAP